MNTQQKVLLNNLVEPKEAELVSDPLSKKGRIFRLVLKLLNSFFRETRPFDSHRNLRRYRLEKIQADSRHYFDIRHY